MTTPTLNTEKDFLHHAAAVAQLSPDPSRKTGCVIELIDGGFISGYNTFPKGVEPRLERPAKYTYIEHAERNAIYLAAKLGRSVDWATIYLTWYPCAECARAIVSAGIKKLVGYEPDWSETRYGFNDAKAILQEGGVEVVFVERD